MAAPLAAASPLPDLSPEAAIEEFLNSLKRPLRLLVAVSGGSDSLGLLLLLKQAIEKQNAPHRHSLAAATIDHGLRAEAADEARSVAQLSDRLGIPHRIECWHGSKPQTGLSAAARDARYRLLANAAKVMGADVLVTGHTLDDQIETIAMRAARSVESALGLAGMAPATLYANHLWILRPLLRTRRAAIRSYLEECGQSWIEDPSNEDTRYERVRTRQSAPTATALAIAQAASHRRSLTAAAAAWLESHAKAGPGPLVTLVLDHADEAAAEPAKLALASLIAALGGKPHRPGAASLDRLSAALAKASDFRLTLAGTLIVRRRDQLFLVRERRGLLPLLLAPGSRGIWDGRYTVLNESSGEITIAAGPASTVDPALPGATRAALAGTGPQLLDRHGISRQLDVKITVKPRLSLYADFMPCFDQPLADAIARLIGVEPGPSCPI